MDSHDEAAPLTYLKLQPANSAGDHSDVANVNHIMVNALLCSDFTIYSALFCMGLNYLSKGNEVFLEIKHHTYYII